jgi:hypothetical protein
MSLCDGVNGPENCDIALNNVERRVGSYNNQNIQEYDYFESSKLPVKTMLIQVWVMHVESLVMEIC